MRIGRAAVLRAAQAIAENHWGGNWGELSEEFRRTCLVDARAALVATGHDVEDWIYQIGCAKCNGTGRTGNDPCDNCGFGFR